MVALYKNNGAVSCVGIYFLFNPLMPKVELMVQILPNLELLLKIRGSPDSMYVLVHVGINGLTLPLKMEGTFN